MGTFPREGCFPKHDALHNKAPFDAGGLGRRSEDESRHLIGNGDVPKHDALHIEFALIRVAFFFV